MKPLLVLIVAEENTLQDGLLALLTTMPEISTVLIAENYSSGIRMIKNHHPGLLVLDMAIQEKGAVKILEQIKFQRLEIKTIVLTDNNEDIKSAIKPGTERYLLKGFTVSKLVSLIEELLNQ